MESHDLIRRQYPGAYPDDVVLWPFVGADLTVRLLPGELVQWWGEADVSLLRYNRALPEGDRYEYAWNLLETAQVFITNGRLVYRANTLVRKPGYRTGLQAGVQSTFGSSVPRPDAYAGHLRFEWIANVILQTQRKLGLSCAVLQVTVLGQDSLPRRLTMTFQLKRAGLTEPAVRALADALAGGVARHRVATRAAALSPAELAALTSRWQADSPVALGPDGFRWDIPGAVPVGTVPVATAPVATAAARRAPVPALTALTRAIDALNLPATP